METLAAALEREHREIDEGIEAFTEGHAGGENRAASLASAMAALRRHIYLEEEFLFPPLRDAGLVAPVFVMVREHAQMWQILDTLDAELGRSGTDAPVPQLCRELVAQLAAHNPKEEQILYPQADDVLDVEATTDLKTFINTGTMPAGWVCEGHRRNPPLSV